MGTEGCYEAPWGNWDPAWRAPESEKGHHSGLRDRLGEPRTEEVLMVNGKPHSSPAKSKFKFRQRCPQEHLMGLQITGRGNMVTWRAEVLG